MGSLEAVDGFYIEDDGVSTDPEAVDRIFEPGYSIDGDDVGLGLSIIECVAAMHDCSFGVYERGAAGVASKSVIW
ncbi:hypothetical protein OB919_06400 [Halobacteria archaeon AArc-curdl1]|uniref:Histidine kinase/HSP90-like ATPase domain-containing protein n=1 Tax=Natronosalvus hydrolyticus TaxID=2979988 RepID=A0AAP2Z6U1_9EURY|nr:hypothetical protein [Halobacteria archaeon AArc-curdl1]